MGLWGVASRSMAIAPAPCSGDLQRITGGLLTEMALVMPRTGRRAYILLCMVPGRGDPSVRCRRCDHRLVLTETRQALLSRCDPKRVPRNRCADCQKLINRLAEEHATVAFTPHLTVSGVHGDLAVVSSIESRTAP